MQINLEKGRLRVFHSNWRRSTRWSFSFLLASCIFFRGGLVIEDFQHLDCKTVGFFLKISKEIGKAWRKSRRACEAREKKPTVRFPYNEFVPTRGFKNVVELSKICSQLHPLCEFDRLACYY